VNRLAVAPVDNPATLILHRVSMLTSAAVRPLIVSGDHHCILTENCMNSKTVLIKHFLCALYRGGRFHLETIFNCEPSIIPHNFILVKGNWCLTL